MIMVAFRGADANDLDSNLSCRNVCRLSESCRSQADCAGRFDMIATIAYVDGATG